MKSFAKYKKSNKAIKLFDYMLMGDDDIKPTRVT